MVNFLLYGAYGYTGELIARAAARQDLRPILAGRREPELARLAGELGLEYRVFSLEDRANLDSGLRDVTVVLHCAGPFRHTARPMADACLRNRVHYLDITGEADVLEMLAQRDQEARSAGVMLLPGVGFDVVPSDCLAAHLKRRLPSATRLALGFQAPTRLSRGTATTVVESLAQTGMIRQDGVLRSVPAAYKVRSIDFGQGLVKAMTIPWGDVVTAYYSTGIPNIEVYMSAPLGLRLAARISRHLRWFLGSTRVQRWLKRRIGAGPAGPTAQERQHGKSYLWGEVCDDAGRRAVSRLSGPESYDLTVQTALAVVHRVLAGATPAGFQTPATAHGADFTLELDGVRRDDEPAN
jgi:short subunit dehydrogenase-like uncharacterized protein